MEMKQIGDIIRQSRAARQLSQAELAQSLGMSRATISGIETGRIAEIGLRKIMALCAALGLELSVGPRSAYPTLQTLRREQHEQRRT
jgi:HTH-type transcriptional regulator / antitoxin HipB